jgi:GNAT superfamily N-acetyltransferase
MARPHRPAPRHIGDGAAAPADVDGQASMQLDIALPVPQITLRCAMPTDADGLRRFLTGLTPRTAYLRFFTGLGHVPNRLLRWLLPDAGRVVLLALVAGEVVGHAMYVTVADDAADLAVVVADAWQRQGLGPRLVRELLDVGRLHGLREIRFTILAGNLPAHRMLARFGTTPRGVLDDGVYSYELRL